jgi:hypothetical protein
MRATYTLLFAIILTIGVIFSKMLDNFYNIIYILTGCLLIGLCLKFLTKKQFVKDIGHVLFYGSLITSILFTLFMFYLANALK